MIFGIIDRLVGTTLKKPTSLRWANVEKITGLFWL